MVKSVSASELTNISSPNFLEQIEKYNNDNISIPPELIYLSSTNLETSEDIFLRVVKTTFTF